MKQTLDNKYCTLQKFKKINLWFTGPLNFEDSYTALTVHVTKCTVLIIANWKILSNTDKKTNHSIRFPLNWIAISVEKKKCIWLKKVMLSRHQSLLQLDHVLELIFELLICKEKESAPGWRYNTLVFLITVAGWNIKLQKSQREVYPLFLKSGVALTGVNTVCNGIDLIRIVLKYWYYSTFRILFVLVYVRTCWGWENAGS